MKTDIKRILFILIENDPGVLLRIISLITRRRFNLETISISDCEDKNYKRLTLSIKNEQQGSDHSTLQLLKHIKKLINVIDAQDISYLPTFQRELILIKISLTLKERQEILELANIYGFTIIDMGSTTISLEITGDSSKIETIEKILKNYNIVELTRTGKIALTREPNSNLITLH